jgi:hypothetical protein
VHDLGTNTSEPVDYPDTAGAVALHVARGEADAGIAIDGAGLGSAIAANKVDGVRAAMCADRTLARYAREHNGANVLALGSTLVTTPTRWLSWTRFLARRCVNHATSDGWRRCANWNAASTLMQPVDLQRLIQIIVEEVTAAQSAPARRGAPVIRSSMNAARTGCAACSMQAPRGLVCTPAAVRRAASRR